MVPPMDAVLQSELPDDSWLDAAGRGLPGVQPLLGPWLRVDDACQAQLALRDRLIAEVPGQVLASLPGSDPALSELRRVVAKEVVALPGYSAEAGAVIRPDGVQLDKDLADLTFVGRACQEDFCLLEKSGAQHVLTAASLCFPAGWRLAEKLGRPLTAIHDPVTEYDENTARRVQRLFDGLQVARPIWRANALVFHDSSLHQPLKCEEKSVPRYFRSEFQCLKRLPETRAIVFSIRTLVLDMSRLAAADRARLPLAEGLR